MPLIKNGQEIADMGVAALSLENFLETVATQDGSNTPLAVVLQPADDPAALIPHFDRLERVDISFPKYTDGRGYSQAQLLRRRYGYTGELRAVGEVLQDQIFYMNRSGFDAFLTSRAALSKVIEALAELTLVYQPGAAGSTPIFARRDK